MLDGKALHAPPHQGDRAHARPAAAEPDRSRGHRRSPTSSAAGAIRTRGCFARLSAHDDEVVAQALAATGTADLADRSVDELSGGQRQRVWIAMALAQETDILLLDEPTTFLDVAHQVEVLDLLTDLNRDRGTTIVMVLHDINLAARYADHLFAMRDGRIVASGPPSEVMTSELIRDVFDLDALVVPDPVSGTPIVLPRGRHHILTPEPEETRVTRS